MAGPRNPRHSAIWPRLPWIAGPGPRSLVTLEPPVCGIGPGHFARTDGFPAPRTVLDVADDSANACCAETRFISPASNDFDEPTMSIRQGPVRPRQGSPKRLSNPPGAERQPKGLLTSQRCRQARSAPREDPGFRRSVSRRSALTNSTRTGTSSAPASSCSKSFRSRRGRSAKALGIEACRLNLHLTAMRPNPS